MTRYSCLIALALAACSQEASAPEEEAAPASDPPTIAVSEAPSELPRYTRLTGCTLTRSAPEEAGFVEHVCGGEGGYRLRSTESDLRENLIVLSPDGGEHNLELPALANGAFSSLGKSVEWRGAWRPEGFVPAAIIVRHSVMEDPDPTVPEVSYLVVARLTPPVCVVARVPPGPNQNLLARELADAGGGCLGNSV